MSREGTAEMAGDEGKERRANDSQGFKAGHQRRRGRRERDTKEREKAISQRPKTAAEKARSEKEACLCLQQNLISKGDKRDGTANYRVVKCGSVERGKKAQGPLSQHVIRSTKPHKTHID